MVDVEIRHLRREAFGGDLEGGVRPGAGLIEQHEHGLALKGGDFFHRAGEQFFKGRGLVEQELDFLTVKGCDVEQVFTCHTGVGENKCVVSTCESEVLPYLFNNTQLNGHKKTVSDSETVAGQKLEKTTEIPEVKSGKPIVAKTFRSTRGSLPSRVPRFINKFFG